MLKQDYASREALYQGRLVANYLQLCNVLAKQFKRGTAFTFFVLLILPQRITYTLVSGISQTFDSSLIEAEVELGVYEPLHYFT